MIQIEQDTDLPTETDQIILTFFTSDMGKYSDDYLAWIQLTKSPPMPSEGDIVNLTSVVSELQDDNTESEFETIEQGQYRVINIDYEYALAEYPEKKEDEYTGGQTSRWFNYAHIEVEEVKG